MAPSLWIALKDLRQRMRDRSAIVLGLVAPLVIAALMSVAFRGVESFHFTLVVADADHSPVSAGLLASLRQPALRDVVTVRDAPDEAAAAAAVRGRRAQAGLIVPSGFAAALAGATPRALVTLTSVNNSTAASVVRSLASSFVAQLDADRVSVATALAAGASPSALGRLESEAAKLTIPERVVQHPLGARPLSIVSYYSPAMAIFFLLFTISFTARSFFVDRAQGMIERIRAAPVRPVEILAGKSLAAFVFGLASLSVVAVVTSAGFGARWGDPVGVGLVCLALVCSVVSLTALVIGVSRTQRQAEGISSAVVFTLALVGGNFVSIANTPPLMRRLALCTPNGWALRAFTDMSTAGGGVATVVVPVLAILAFSAVVAVAAALIAPRAVAA